MKVYKKSSFYNAHSNQSYASTKKNPFAWLLFVDDVLVINSFSHHCFCVVMNDYKNISNILIVNVFAVSVS